MASIWGAARAADRAAADLAQLVLLLRRAAPDRPVDLIGHSLGARVILGALPQLPAGAVGRMILMAGAEFVERAVDALSTPAGRSAEVVNIVSRENDVFDWLFETALAPLGGYRALGGGLGHLPNAVDVQIDGRAARRGLARLGYRLAEPRLRVCHWSVYLRPGVFPLYRGLLHRRAHLSLDRLRDAMAAAPAEPRWARLLAPRATAPLPSSRPDHTLPA
jgi:pimeloyl-ACP methyl ester carboxylesterase